MKLLSTLVVSAISQLTPAINAHTVNPYLFMPEVRKLLVEFFILPFLFYFNVYCFVYYLNQKDAILLFLLLVITTFFTKSGD